MVGEFLRWLRVVFPPWWAVIAYFLVFAFVLGFEIFLKIWLAWGMDYHYEGIDQLTLHSLLILPGLIGYAVWRVWAFHPALYSRYRQWLEKTPWESTKPFPLGPVHVVWQDVFVVGIAMMMWSLPPNLLYVPLGFLLPYCVLLTAANIRTNVDGAAIGSVALMAAMLLVVDNAAITLLLMLGVYLICHLGMRQSLKKFPWSESERWQSLTLDAEARNRYHTMGWPMVHDANYGKLRTYLTLRQVGWISSLGGWIAFCLTACYLNHAELTDRQLVPENLQTCLILFCIPCFIGRLTTYCHKHWFPISLRGRLLSGRWLNRGYDKVFVAPTLILFLSYFLPGVLIAWSLPLALVAGVTVCAVLAIAFGMGPSLSVWHLTGEYRMKIHRPGTGWLQL